MNSKFFVKKLIIFSIAIALVCLAVNCYVLIGSTKFIASNERIGKLIYLKVNPVKSVILGTSRARYGYDPSNDLFSHKTYNLSAAAVNIAELNLYLDTLLDKKSSVNEVFLALDYMMFCDENSINPKLSEALKNPNALYGYFFSFDVLKKVFKINKKEPYFMNGYRQAKKRSEFPFLEYSDYNKDRKLNPNSLNQFNELLAKLYAHDIKVTIVFNPSSALCWENMAQWGWFEDWLKWKKNVVIINEKVCHEFADTPYPVYDFAVYNKYTTEVEPTGKYKFLKYYRDISHFNVNLGNLVLGAIKSGHLGELGQKVDSNNIDSHILDLKKKRNSYMEKLKPFVKKFEHSCR